MKLIQSLVIPSICWGVVVAFVSQSPRSVTTPTPLATGLLIVKDNQCLFGIRRVSTALASDPSTRRQYTTAGAPRDVANYDPRGRGRGRGRGGGRGGRGGFRSYQSGRGRGGGGPYGGGGPAGPAIKLANPLKIQRVAYKPPAVDRAEQEQRGRDGGPPQRGSRARDAATVDLADAPLSDKEQRPPSRGSQGGNRRRGGGGGAGGGGRPQSRDDVRRVNRPMPMFASGRKGKGRAAMMNLRRGSLKRRDKSKSRADKEEAALLRRSVELPGTPLTVAQLADVLDEKPVAVIKLLMTELGIMAAMTQSLDPQTCIAVAEGFGRIVGGDEEDEEGDEEAGEDEEAGDESAISSGFALEEEDDEADLITRPPVVTIMGHVDHGKTSLLDAIRHTRVTEGEAGGITQHITAYQVYHNNEKITFIDTPGHAAFTDMRERGANITDIVILVVAADDSVKQQTADSIACARQAGVPVVVAINKIDLETADPNRVLSDLTGYDVLTEDLGGEVLSAQISAKENIGLDDLLDKIMLQAEVQDLKANPDRLAQGAIVEARVEKGLGTVATTLVQKGTLKIGDYFVAGNCFGKVRALIGTDGKTRLKKAGPSFPINVVGFEGVPAAGDLLVVLENEQMARELAESRSRLAREKESTTYQSDLMSSLSAGFGVKEKREMVVLVKGDVQGSAEALSRALTELKMENEEVIVSVKVLVSEAGEVTKSDIAIASVTPGTSVIAFGVPAAYDAMEEARALGIDIEYFSIVYDAIETIKERMQEVLSPTPEGEFVGRAVVQEVFDIGGTGNIAGSRCTDGFLRKGGNVRVMRGDKILTETKIKTLRNFKTETERIEEGSECGIGLEEFEDFQPDDIIECFVET